MTADVPDPRFHDQLAEEDVRDALMDPLSRTVPSSQVWGIAEALLPAVTKLLAEVEARVQAAANQRAAEAATDALMWAAWTVEHSPGIKHQARAVTAIRDRVATLASPAPAPHAEEGQR